LNSKVCTCPKSQRSRLPTITYLWLGSFSDALCALSQCTSYCTFASLNAEFKTLVFRGCSFWVSRPNIIL
jgi:hypothetical protein